MCTDIIHYIAVRFSLTHLLISVSDSALSAETPKDSVNKVIHKNSIYSMKSIQSYSKQAAKTTGSSKAHSATQVKDCNLLTDVSK